MINNAKLIEKIDYEKIMPMSRYSGGHDEQMKGLIKNSIVLAHWNEEDYQGQVATMIQLEKSKIIVIYEDYYGSCSGCDAWEDANNDEVRKMCLDLASTAQIFKNKEEAIKFLNEKGEYGKISDKCRKGLLQNLGEE